MQPQTHHHIERYLKILIVLAALVLIFLCALLVQQYSQVRRLNYIAAHESVFAALRAHGPVTPSDASLVQPWMTFDYLNHLFTLPPNYLQTTLSITDPRYPRVTIEEYAEDARLPEQTFLLRVQAAVRAYAPAS